MIKTGLLIVGLSIMLSGCVYRSYYEEPYVKPTVEVVYYWDAGYVRYYYLQGNRKYYMPYGWKHPLKGVPESRH